MISVFTNEQPKVIVMLCIYIVLENSKPVVLLNKAER